MILRLKSPVYQEMEEATVKIMKKENNGKIIIKTNNVK